MQGTLAPSVAHSNAIMTVTSANCPDTAYLVLAGDTSHISCKVYIAHDCIMLLCIAEDTLLVLLLSEEKNIFVSF